MRSNAGMANGQGGVDLPFAQDFAPHLSFWPGLAWLGLTWLDPRSGLAFGRGEKFPAGTLTTIPLLSSLVLPSEELIVAGKTLASLAVLVPFLQKPAAGVWVRTVQPIPIHCLRGPSSEVTIPIYAWSSLHASSPQVYHQFTWYLTGSQWSLVQCMFETVRWQTNMCTNYGKQFIVCFVGNWRRYNKCLCMFMGNKYKISIGLKISVRVFKRRNTCQGLKCMFVWLHFPSPSFVRSRRTDLSAQDHCVHSAVAEVICRRWGNIACLRQSKYVLKMSVFTLFPFRWRRNIVFKPERDCLDFSLICVGAEGRCLSANLFPSEKCDVLEGGEPDLSNVFSTERNVKPSLILNIR